MKNLQEKIIEGLIVESVAKNVHNPRKGSILYLLKDGEEKTVKVTVENVRKVKDAWFGNSGGYIIDVKLSENEYGIEGWREPHYGNGFDYSDEKYQVTSKSGGAPDNRFTYYVGVSPHIIQQYINMKGADKLEGLLNKIEKLQSELDELIQKKQKAEQEANLAVHESLKI